MAEDECFGAVHESAANTVRMVQINLVDYNDYFNADVLLLKPQFFRDNLELILSGCKFIFDNGHKFFEQDTLNYLFSKKYLKLPYCFNYAVGSTWGLAPELRRVEKAIYHYAGDAKPRLNTNDIFNRLFLEYFLKTPWATADMFGNLDKAVVKMVEQIFNESRNILLHVTNLLGSRRRAFLVDKDFLEPAKQIFAITADELVMDTSVNEKTLLKKMTATRGKICLFILTNYYPQIGTFLVSQNFIEGTDFINGFLFLSEYQGFKVNFDTKPIVKEL